jgi:hypothetical protein
MRYGSRSENMGDCSVGLPLATPCTHTFEFRIQIHTNSKSEISSFDTCRSRSTNAALICSTA